MPTTSNVLPPTQLAVRPSVIPMRAAARNCASGARSIQAGGNGRSKMNADSADVGPHGGPPAGGPATVATCPVRSYAAGAKAAPGTAVPSPASSVSVAPLPAVATAVVTTAPVRAPFGAMPTTTSPTLKPRGVGEDRGGGSRWIGGGRDHAALGAPAAPKYTVIVVGVRDFATVATGCGDGPPPGSATEQQGHRL